MKICVIGTGYVGLVSGACFADLGNDVICVDKDIEKIATLKRGEMPIYEPGLEEIIHRSVKEGRLTFTTSISEGVEISDIIFIAVGTPPQDDGSADLSFVEVVARDIALNMKSYKVIVEKSTVPVETGEWVRQTIQKNNKHQVEFDVVSNPEFLREGTAIYDTMHPDRIVIGVSNPRAEEIMRELYKPFNAPIIITDIKSAEIIKHASNAFLSTKISFINAVARICELAGADVLKVAEGMGYDNRIGKAFLNAGCGFGGFCFPKDLEAFIHISNKLGYNFELLKVVKKINEEQKAIMIKKIKSVLWILKDKTIGILGLAFKPNTDDMRFAPSIDIIQQLQQEGVKIKAFDPVAMERAKHVLRDVEYCSNAYDVAKEADCLTILTEWNEFRELDMNRIKSSMKNPIIIDGRNIYEPQRMKEMGITYLGIGRG